jgi:hypothetical protein
LIEILRAVGVIEPQLPETELKRIDVYLLAEPFEPFVIGMTGAKNFPNNADSPGTRRRDRNPTLVSPGPLSIGQHAVKKT